MADARGRKKHITFFNINFLAPTQKTQFGPPEKSSCASFPGKERQKGTHINFFGGISVSKRGQQTGHFRPQKVEFIVFFLPLDAGEGEKGGRVGSSPNGGPRASPHCTWRTLPSSTQPPSPPPTLSSLFPPTSWVRGLAGGKGPRSQGGGRGSQESRGLTNSREIAGTPANCFWNTRRDKQGSTGGRPRDFLFFAIGERAEKGIFAGTPAGCARDSQPSRVFRHFM